jgi:hypothetical protein
MLLEIKQFTAPFMRVTLLRRPSVFCAGIAMKRFRSQHIELCGNEARESQAAEITPERPVREANRGSLAARGAVWRTRRGSGNGCGGTLLLKTLGVTRADSL